jgi:hypothetical protein
MLVLATTTALVAGAVAVVLTVLAVLALDRFLPPRLRREFTVELSPVRAWQHLARVEQWPSWARHIQRVEAQPPGELGPASTGRFHISKVIKPVFTMTEFNPYRNWKWLGGFLWLTIYYDHRFEELNPTQTRLIWVVEATGFGVSLFGRLFAKIYSRNLDRAIPLLVQEMNAQA